MQKIVCLRQVFGTGKKLTEFKELDTYLQSGWHIVQMQTVGSYSDCCCYVWLENNEVKQK